PNSFAHDFPCSDSWLPFTAKLAGDYFIRLTEQGGGGGPRHRYRLTVRELRPDFQLYVWPDAVPVWGPGTTAAFVVHMQHWGKLNADVRMTIEGLPDGWVGGGTVISSSAYGVFGPPTGMSVLLTITAPADAKLGDTATFRVVGRAEQGGR